jgi:SAM-dependent methyltransferase
MNPSPQVDRSHYAFERYMSKARWASLWHQLDEVLRLAPRRVLEIGPGPGVFKRVAGQFGVTVETLDLDPALQPDHVGSATALPFADGEFDVVCAFQMLEHLPYEQSMQAWREMVRVARRHLVISLPDARTVWPVSVHLPRLGVRRWLVPKPSFGLAPHRFDGEHHWEINKRGFELARVSADLASACELIKTYRVHELPYHRFFVFRR